MNNVGIDVGLRNVLILYFKNNVFRNCSIRLYSLRDFFIIFVKFCIIGFCCFVLDGIEKNVCEFKGFVE